MFIFCLAVTLSGGLKTAEAGGKQINTIDTRVIYLNKMMLPPGSTVTVTLADVSKMDVKAELLATKTVKAEGGPPYRVAVDYDADMIDDRMRYSLRGVIENGGQLLYSSTENIDPFSSMTAQPIEIILRPVQSEAEPSDTAQSLSSTAWKLASMGGSPAGPGADGKDVSLSFSADGKSVMGYSGCNSFNGSFESSGNQLTFGLMASTMRMCADPDVMELEQSFHRALGAVERFEIAGNELILLDAENNTLAILQGD